MSASFTSSLHCPGISVNWEVLNGDLPFGAAKCITLPSSLNMLTSSIAWMGCTFIFFSVVCNFLSSVPEVLCTFLVLRRGVPLPL